MAISTYFLGGNTAKGFYSLYGAFCSGKEDFLWVLKGGAGCGKSSFMRLLGAAAEEAGLDVEYVLCSGDPASLDGVYVPAWKTGYVDGTSPHVLEPDCAGVNGAYVDLGRFYDRKALKPLRSSMEDLSRRYQEQYKIAYDLLKTLPKPEPACRAMPEKHRFASALTCQGLVQLNIPETGSETIWYLHPVWPELPEAVWDAQKGELRRFPVPPAPELSQIVSHLQQAKQLHDELEAASNPYVDFAGIYALAQVHISRLKRENSPL